MIKQNKNSGYTLIELIIVVAIIAVFAVFAIPGFSKVNVRNDFDSKAEEIVLLLNHAYAIGNSPERIETATDGRNCDVGRVVPSAGNIILKYLKTQDDGSVVVCSTASNDLIETVKLSGGFTVSVNVLPITPPTPLEFSVNGAKFNTADIDLSYDQDTAGHYNINVKTNPFIITKKYVTGP